MADDMRSTTTTTTTAVAAAAADADTDGTGGNTLNAPMTKATDDDSPLAVDARVTEAMPSTNSENPLPPPVAMSVTSVEDAVPPMEKALAGASAAPSTTGNNDNEAPNREGGKEAAPVQPPTMTMTTTMPVVGQRGDPISNGGSSDSNSSSSSGSSSSSSSSSSDSSSSDSEVEDVTEECRSRGLLATSSSSTLTTTITTTTAAAKPPTLATDVVEGPSTVATDVAATSEFMDEEEAEQWFQDAPDLDADGLEIVGVVESRPEDGDDERGFGGDVEDDDDEDAFLVPYSPIKESTTLTVDVTSSTATFLGPKQSVKGRNQGDDDGDDSDSDVEILPNPVPAEETTSSSEADDSDAYHRAKDPLWEQKQRAKREERRRQRRARESDKSGGASRKRQRRGSPTTREAPVKYRTIPPEFDIFNDIPRDDHEFPILKGLLLIKSNSRAHFTGSWGFTDGDFDKNLVSDFSYSSASTPPKAPGARHHRRRRRRQLPPSGKYTGHFMLRQFSGKRVRIKEDQIEFHFIRLSEDGERAKVHGSSSSSDSSDDGDDEDAAATAKYEVIGKGKNRFGRFLVRGYYSASNDRMTVRRRYLE